MKTIRIDTAPLGQVARSGIVNDFETSSFANGIEQFLDDRRFGRLGQRRASRTAPLEIAEIDLQGIRKNFR